MTSSFTCHLFHKHECQSCPRINQPYLEGVQEKQEHIETLFPHKVRTIIPVDYINASRNKAKMAVLGDLDNPLFGFLDENRVPHNIDTCPLHLPDINALLATIKKHLKEYKLTPYNIHTRRGELKYLLITQSDSSREILLRFVVRSRESLPRIQKVTDAVLLPTFAQLKVVSVNLQPEPKATLEGKEEIFLTKTTHIATPLGNINLYLGVRSFFQVTSPIALKLYTTAAQILDRIKSKNVLDLYCGVGAFALFAASPQRSVTGVEISPDAISYATLGAQKNNLNNCTFIADDVGHFIQTTTATYDTIIINPPRRGLNPEIIRHILRLRPSSIIYSSCNPTSLRRDIDTLSPTYHLEEITPFDMFPLTNHVECLALLTLQPLRKL